MRTTRLFGLDFVVGTSIEEVVDTLQREGQADDAMWRVVVTPNVDHLVHYRKSPTQRRVAETAYMVLPDGAPIVWASRLLRAPIDQRLAGSDLFAAWWQRMVAAERPVIMVAGNEHSLGSCPSKIRTVVASFHQCSLTEIASALPPSWARCWLNSTQSPLMPSCLVSR